MRPSFQPKGHGDGDGALPRGRNFTRPSDSSISMEGFGHALCLPQHLGMTAFNGSFLGPLYVSSTCLFCVFVVAFKAFFLHQMFP